LKFLALIIGIAGVYFSLIEWRVRSIIKDPDFVAAVAKQSRPSMVFDGEGRVILDSGALALLREPPEVVRLILRSEEGGDPKLARITIKPNNALKSEPLIQSLDYGNVAVIAERGPGLSWIIHINARTIYVAMQNEKANLAPPRFRLELQP
jgi:hypothetical protein